MAVGSVGTDKNYGEVCAIPSHIAIAQSVAPELQTSLVHLDITPLNFILNLFWPAAKEIPGILAINATEMWVQERPFEQQIPLLRILDAPISEILTFDSPLPVKSTLYSLRDDIGQVRERLPKVMPMLSGRRLIEVVGYGGLNPSATVENDTIYALRLCSSTYFYDTKRNCPRREGGRAERKCTGVYIIASFSVVTIVLAVDMCRASGCISRSS